MSNSVTGMLTIISSANDTVVGSVSLGGSLGRMAITPDSSRLFVHKVWEDCLILRFSNNSQYTHSFNQHFCWKYSRNDSITPDGKTAYTSSATNSTLTIIDIATRNTTGIINLPPGSGPYGSSILPNNTLLFTANLNNSTVSVINMTTQTVLSTITLGITTSPFWMAPTPDSKTVFLVDQASHIIPIDTQTLLAGTPLGGPGFIKIL